MLVVLAGVVLLLFVAALVLKNRESVYSFTPNLKSETLKERDDNQKKGGRAIVVGGGIGGLLTAKALREFYTRVDIIEGDSYPEKPEPRAGAPQSTQVHVVTLKGLAIIKHLFPGIMKQELGEFYIPEFDMFKDMRMYFMGGFFKQEKSDLIVQMPARNYIEWGMRQRLLKCKDVHFHTNCTVTNLIRAESSNVICGVKYRQRTTEGTQKRVDNTEMKGDFVVVCNGRQSRLPEWLHELGYSKPSTVEVQIDVGYTTVLGRVKKGDNNRPVVYLPNAPKNYIGSVIFPVTSDISIFMLGGCHKHHPPGDLDELLEFTKNLPVDFVYKEIENREWLGKPTTYRFPASRWNEYHKNSDFPEGLVAIGDCVSSFNPLYGQGMTSSAVGAYTLYHLLSKKHSKAETKEEFQKSVVNERGSFSKEFMKLYSSYLNDAWAMAVGGDLKFPETEGKRGPLTGPLNDYTENLLKVAQTDSDIRMKFTLVSNSTAPPIMLFHPYLLWRVAKYKLASLWSAKSTAQKTD